MDVKTILNACPWDTQINYLTQFIYSVIYWLMRFPLLTLLLGGLFVIGFLIISGLVMRGFILLRRGRSIKRLWLWGFPVALFLSLSPLLIGEPLLTTFLPPYYGQTADAVVVLGRGQWLDAGRVIAAADLVLKDSAPQVFISGYGDAPRIATMLAQLGVSPNKISGENCSGSTEEHAQYAAQQLFPQGVKSIILVSDPPHLLRSRLVFSSFGFDVIPYPSPLPYGTSVRYRRTLAFRESLGLVSYGLMGRYWPRPIKSVETTAAQ